MRTAEEAKRLLDDVLARVSADEATAYCGRYAGHATRFGENAITQNMGGEREEVGVTVAFGSKRGSSSATRTDDGALRELVARAEANAKASPEDPEHVSPPGPQEYPETPQRYYEDVDRMTPHDLADRIAHAIGAAKDAGDRTGGLFGYGSGYHAVANSKGLFAYDRHSGVDCSLTVHGSRGSGSASFSAETTRELDTAALVERASETAHAAQDPEDIEPGDYTVVFEPQAVADLLGPLIWSMDARAADEGSTVFAGAVGTRIAAENVTISTVIDSPLLPSAKFGDAGLASRPTTWVRNGVLERLRHDRYWASRKETHADPSIHPVFVSGEDRSLEDLVAQCEDGVLVKRLWYIRFVDRKQMLLTGMTRDGFFRIEDGKVSHPVKNLRFNESPLVFLRNAVAMSRAERVEGAMVAPGVMSREFTFSSTTESV